MQDEKLNEETQEEIIDWKAMLRRKDRPLPKVGCSWAFYLFLIGLIVLFIVYYCKYKQM